MAVARPRPVPFCSWVMQMDPAPVPVLGKGRVLGYRALQAQAAEPAIRQVQVHLLAQPPLRSDTEAVTDDQHPDHQFGIDRGTPGVAVIRREVLPQVAQIKDAVDASQQMVGGNVGLETEGVKQLLLRRPLLSHHRGVTLSLVVPCLQTRPSDGGSPSFSTE